MAKADLVARESDRISLIAKASRLLQERLGRGFEILPAASDLNSLLDIIEDCMPKWDAGRMRTWQLSQDSLTHGVDFGFKEIGEFVVHWCPSAFPGLDLSTNESRDERFAARP